MARRPSSANFIAVFGAAFKASIRRRFANPHRDHRPRALPVGLTAIDRGSTHPTQRRIRAFWATVGFSLPAR